MSATGIIAVPFWRSITGRLALSVMVMVIAATMVLYAVTASQMQKQATLAVEASVDTDLTGLADIYASGNQQELVQRLNDRIQFADPERGRVYILDAKGQQLAGNLAAWPGLDALRSEMGNVRDASGRVIRGRATQLSPDLRLFVGQRMLESDELLSALRRGFIAAGVLVALLALLSGYWLSRRLARRVDAIDNLHRQAARGELQSAPVNPRGGDELTVLSARTQAMLQRQVGLIDLYRESSEHAAHEIRTPLMHLDTRLHKLLGQSADPRVQDAVSAGREEIRSVVRLLESLLDISSAQAHLGDTSDFERIELSELVARIVEIYSDIAEDQDYLLSAEIHPDIAIYGNGMQLERIVSNLLDNAFKFCAPGDRIEVQLEPGPILRVSDSGPGVAPELREKIFSRFTRGNGVQARGHGLGLPLAQAFAARHGLLLRIADSEHGACFELVPMDNGKA